MKTHTQSHDEFVAMLNKVLAKIKERAESQYKYNLETNVPKKIAEITLDNAADHAIKNGLVSGINHFYSWDINEAVRMAHHLLEDCNYHEAARELNKFIPEYQMAGK